MAIFLASFWQKDGRTLPSTVQNVDLNLTFQCDKFIKVYALFPNHEKVRSNIQINTLFSNRKRA